jgi:hypothetical protein
MAIEAGGVGHFVELVVSSGMDEKIALAGVSQRERDTMLALLKMRPEQHKSAPRVDTAKGRAQRRRREKERVMQPEPLPG